MRLLCEGLKVNKSIDVLDLQENKIGNDPNNYLLLEEVFKDNKTIREVDYWGLK